MVVIHALPLNMASSYGSKRSPVLIGISGDMIVMVSLLRDVLEHTTH